MGIRNDAGKIFQIIYQQYLNKERVNAEILLEKSGMGGEEIDRAIKYLKDLGVIEVIHTLGNFNGVQNFIFRKIRPEGINIAEDDDLFYHMFKVTKEKN